jgi:EmrB/QacA subfamily drug resistance transporter
MGLGVEHDDPLASLRDGGAHQRGGQSRAAMVHRGGDPADSDPSVGLRKHSERARDDVTVAGPDHQRARFEVTPVQLRVRTPLLDDEHVDSQAQDRIERRWIDLAKWCDVDIELICAHGRQISQIDSRRTPLLALSEGRSRVEGMRKWLPLVAVCLGTFMLLVDVTIVNVALPDMADNLHTSFSSLQWVVDGYALALAALVLGTGSIADLIGHRRAYIGGLALFAVSSFVCGISPNANLLIVARVVQGVGAAAMFATTFALLNSSYQGRDRGTAYGLWGAVSGASAAIGPIVGGLLTEGISWRWIFFVNLPVSIAAIAMCYLVLDGDHESTKVKIDILGMVTFAASAGLITYSMIRATEDGWGATSTLSIFAAGVVLLAVFVVVELRSDHSMLDMRLLRNRSFVGILIAALLLTFAAFAYFTYTSIWLQSVLGLSPIQAGLTGLPLSVAAFAVSAAIGRFLHRTRPGPIIGGGLILIGVGGLVSAVVVHGSASWPALIPGYLISGLGVGLATPTLSSSAMSAVPIQRGGMAAGAVNTARQLGFAFGIALLGSVFATRAESSLSGHGTPDPSRVANALAGGQAPVVLAKAPASTRAGLDHAMHVASISGLQGTFVVAGVAGLVAGLIVLVLVRPNRPAAEPGASAAREPESGSPAETNPGSAAIGAN